MPIRSCARGGLAGNDPANVAWLPSLPDVYVDGDDGKILAAMDGSRATCSRLYYALQNASEAVLPPQSHRGSKRERQSNSLTVSSRSLFPPNLEIGPRGLRNLLILRLIHAINLVATHACAEIVHSNLEDMARRVAFER